VLQHLHSVQRRFRQDILVMMIMILVVVCGPGPDCGADDDSVHLGAHGVFNIGRHQQVASDRVAFCPGFVESIAESYFQLPLDNGNAGVLAVPMVLPISGGNEEGVCESFPGYASVTF